MPAFSQFVCNKTRACRKIIRGLSYNKERLDLSAREERVSERGAGGLRKGFISPH
jgi:hypothetical protein